MNSLINKPFLLLIKGYQYFLSPLIGTQCRFHPSCSNYAYQAIEQYGLVKGSFFTLKRLLRCHPWAKGGIDEIPQYITHQSIHCHSQNTPDKVAK